MQTDLIIINDYCRICHIEPSFIYQLEQDGLIEIRTINGVKYFLSSFNAAHFNLEIIS